MQEVDLITATKWYASNMAAVTIVQNYVTVTPCVGNILIFISNKAALPIQNFASKISLHKGSGEDIFVCARKTLDNI